MTDTPPPQRPVPEDRDAVAEPDMLQALSEANNELMSMHREVATQRLRLEEINRRQEEILATVAHDLRNPLGTIVGFSQTLQRKLGETIDAEDHRLLVRIEVQGRRLLELVEDLVDAAVIERGVAALDVEETDLLELAAEAVALHTPSARRKDISLECRGGEDELVVRLDRSRISQVLDNLLSNAIKFTPAGTDAAVTCQVDRDGDEVRIRVSDPGIGIDPEFLPQVFDPFTRASPRGTAGEPSAGLGLSITRSLVVAHGGTIEVLDSAAGGTTFEVRLPISGPPDADVAVGP